MNRFSGVLLTLILVFGCLTGCSSAEFEFSELTITPSQAVAGEEFIVSAKITNVGNADGIYTARLIVNGTEAATKNVAVLAGTTEIVTFNITEENPETYSISLGNMTQSLKLLSVDEIVDSVIQTMYQVDTYQFDVTMAIKMSGPIDGKESDETIDIGLSGTVDEVNRRMWAEMELNMHLTIPEEEKVALDIEMYIVGNDIYMLVEAEGETSTWMKERLPIGSWGEMTQVDSQVAILETGEVTLSGSEKVRGVDCYMLQIIPDEKELVKMVFQETSIQGEQSTFLTDEIIEELVENALVKQWIRKDTFSQAKTEVVIEGEVNTDEVMGYGEGTLNVNISTTMFLYNYNKQVQIELPTEAKEAIYLYDEDADAYSDRARAYYAQGQYDLAITYYTKAIELNTNDAHAYYTRALAYDELGQYDLAITDYTKVIEFYPNHADAYFNRAYDYGELGQYESAIADYTKAIELNPNDSYAYFNRAHDYDELGQYELAIADYTKVIELNPSDTDAFYNRGYVYFHLGYYGKAIQDFDKVIRLNPDDTDAEYMRELAYNKQEQLD